MWRLNSRSDVLGGLLVLALIPSRRTGRRSTTSWLTPAVFEYERAQFQPGSGPRLHFKRLIAQTSNQFTSLYSSAGRRSSLRPTRHYLPSCSPPMALAKRKPRSRPRPTSPPSRSASPINPCLPHVSRTCSSSFERPNSLAFQSRPLTRSPKM